MDELTGQEIRIVLSLKGGRCFGALKKGGGEKKLLIEATLNGSIIDTDEVALEDEPGVDAELIWEATKKSLRSLRTAGQAIKVQCMLRSECRTRRERVGHLVVSLREAHVVPSGKAFRDVGETWWRWQRLSGAKPPCPELRYCLRLEAGQRDKVNPNLVTRLHPDKGVIQIGADDSALDLFSLVVYMGQAVNLDLLLPENYAPPREGIGAQQQQLFFQYRIMDYAINTKNLPLHDIHRPIALNEKMGISLCSSLESLQQYFSVSSKLLIKLFIAQQEIGTGELSMRDLVPTTHIDRFCSLQSDNSVTIESPCYLKGSVTKEVPSSPKGLQPYIYVRVKLKYEELECRNIGQGEGQTKDQPSGTHTATALAEQQYSVPKVDMEKMESMFKDIFPKSLKQDHAPATRTSPRAHTPGSGDVEDDKQLIKEIKAPSPAQAHLLSMSTSNFTMAPALVSKGCQSEFVLHDSSTQAPEMAKETFHTYALHIAVQVVAFRRVPTERRCFFQFHHPKAEIIRNSHPEITIQQPNQNISLPDMKCKLRFVSTPTEINRLLLAFPPKISICDMAGCRIACANLNMGPLLSEEARQCNSSAQLIDPRTSEDVGILKVLLALEDEGLERFGGGRAMLQRNPSDQDLGPAILDDRIAYRIVEELEDWKERQEILFKSELKKKEAAHLAALTEDWRQRRIELERNLNRNVEQCRMLAQSLNETTDELRLKTCKNAERERDLSKFQDVIERKHKLKMMEVKEAARRMEDDLNLKISSMEREREDLENRMKKLEKENAILKDTIVSQEHDLEELTKSSLTKDQTASLFQEVKSMEEKLESALKSKSFFKEQWTRAVRELHRFKTENHEAIQIQIKHNKEDLLAEDKPPPALDFKAKVSSSSSNSSVGGDNEARLKALVQERDTLIAAGHTLADPTVSKINQEIRGLLIHSNAVT
ncbi:hypothetical protein C0J52_02285 [Blattella germanica]|nr:hypothetical protein C0J52_02285 [Blattella germanica]